MVKTDGVTAIDKMFSKGFLRDKGTNKVPEFFATDVWNLRIKNGGITQRLGFTEIFNGDDPHPIRGMVANEGLYACQNSHFWGFGNLITFSASLVASNSVTMTVNGVAMTPVVFSVDEVTTLGLIATQLKTQFSDLFVGSVVNATTHTITLISRDIDVAITIAGIVVTLGASQPTGTATNNTFNDLGSIGTDNRCRFVTYGIYTIILTGADYPWLYDGTTLTQLSSTQIDVNVNPSFGTTFAGFTIVNDNLNKNILWVSIPITPAAQANCYDWKSSGAQKLTFQSPVLGCIGTLNNLWVFTEKTVQIMDKSNLSNTGGITGLYTIPFSSGYQLTGPDALVAAGDIIFFMTKNNKIGQINYKQQVTQPQMDIISNVFGNSIDEYMIKNLDMDQSDCFMLFDRQYNIVKCAVQSINSTVNDVTIIWDIQNQTRLKDNNKFVSSGCILNDQIYTGSAFSFVVYQDDIGSNDNGDGIEWYYESAEIHVRGPVSVKMFRGAEFSGQLNNLTRIRVQFLVDAAPVFDKTIDGSTIAPASLLFGIGGAPIGGAPIGGGLLGDVITDLVPFERYIDTGGLRNTGKNIKVIFSGGEIGQNFILDYFGLIVRQRVRRLVSDIM